MAKRKRRMSALQAKYFGGGRRKKSSRRSRSPRVVVVSSNPRHKRRRHHRRRMRRNPIGGTGSFIMEAATFGAVATGGLIATQWLQNNLPLPASLQQGNMNVFTGIGMALLVGLGVDMIGGGPALGAAAAAGGMVPVLSQFVSGFTGGGNQYLPGGGAYGYGGGYQQGAGAGYGMGRYLGAMPAAVRLRRMAMLNQRRALRGLPPLQVTRPRLQLGAGPRRFVARPNGIPALNVASGLGASSPYAYTKRRLHRNGGVGYIGPARTLAGMGRYMQTR